RIAQRGGGAVQTGAQYSARPGAGAHALERSGEIIMGIPVGIVGVGNWGFNHARTFSQLPDSDLRLICDLSEARLRRVRDILPEVALTNDYQEIISDDSITAVVIATDAETHYTLAKQDLLAGKEVFVEKPITLDLKEASELVELAEKRNQVLMVGH